jgi:hypothetical protein
LKLVDRKGNEWGLKLVDGARGIQEHSQVASTLQFSGGGTKFGDFEPGMSHIEQRDWSGGRGGDDFSQDPRRYWDSYHLFSALEGKAFPTLQWRLPTGLRTAHSYLPQDGSAFTWKVLTGTQRYISDDFTVGGSNLSADNLYLCIYG